MKRPGEDVTGRMLKCLFARAFAPLKPATALACLLLPLFSVAAEPLKIVRTAYPDPTAESGDWVCVDMKARRPLKSPITLAALKADPQFAELALIRQSRLSVMQLSAAHWQAICALGGVKP